MERDIDRYAVSYSEMPFEPIQAEFRRAFVLEEIKRMAPRSILEVGCGWKPLFIDVDKNIKVCTVEPSQQFYDHACGLISGYSNARLVQGFLEQIAPEDIGTFDLVVLSGVLHEVSQPLALVESAKKFCSTHSRLHINVPNAKSFHRLLALEMGLIDSLYQLSENQLTLDQSNTFDLDSLSVLVQGAGFIIENVGTYFVKPFTHRQMQLLIDREILSHTMLDGLMKLSKHFPDNGSEVYVNARPAL